MRPLTQCCAALLLAACGEQDAPQAAPLVANAAAAPAAAALPALTGRVVDNANLLSPAVEERLSALSARLEQHTSDQLVIVSMPDLGGRSIEQVGLALGRGWRIGQAGKGNGVLLIVAPREHKVRVEVGCGLEPILTDAGAAAIIEQRIVPAFKQSDFGGGTEAGAVAIADTLTAAAATPRVGGCHR